MPTENPVRRVCGSGHSRRPGRMLLSLLLPAALGAAGCQAPRPVVSGHPTHDQHVLQPQRVAVLEHLVALSRRAALYGPMGPLDRHPQHHMVPRVLGQQGVACALSVDGQHARISRDAMAGRQDRAGADERGRTHPVRLDPYRVGLDLGKRQACTPAPRDCQKGG